MEAQLNLTAEQQRGLDEIMKLVNSDQQSRDLVRFHLEVYVIANACKNGASVERLSDTTNALYQYSRVNAITSFCEALLKDMDKHPPARHIQILAKATLHAIDVEEKYNKLLFNLTEALDNDFPERKS